MHTDTGVSVLRSGPAGEVDAAPDVGQLGLVDLPHLPDQQFAHWVEAVLALGWGEAEASPHGEACCASLAGTQANLLGQRRVCGGKKKHQNVSVANIVNKNIYHIP